MKQKVEHRLPDFRGSACRKLIHISGETEITTKSTPATWSRKGRAQNRVGILSMTTAGKMPNQPRHSIGPGNSTGSTNLIKPHLRPAQKVIDAVFALILKTRMLGRGRLDLSSTP